MNQDENRPHPSPLPVGRGDQIAEPPRDRIAFIAPLLIAAGFVAAYAVQIGLPRWPVRDAGERIVYWVGVAAILGMMVDLVCWRTRRWMVPTFALLAAVACLLPDMYPRTVVRTGWTTGGLAVRVVAISIATSILVTLTQRLAVRKASWPLVPLVVAGMTLAAGALIRATGSLKLSDATFCLAVPVCIVAVLSLSVRPFARSGGAILIVFSVLATQLVSGHLWSKTPIWAAVAIAIAPLLAWIVALGPLGRRPRWIGVTAALLLAALPASIAVGITSYRAMKALEAESTSSAGTADEVW